MYPAEPPQTRPSSDSLPGVSRLICRPTKQFPRYSEADVAVLADGRLLLAVARKNGNDDFARGEIVGMFSEDDGRTWDDRPHLILAPWADTTDLMSVSLFRTPRGLHLLFLARGADAQRDTRAYQILSADEGRTWADPVLVSVRPGYHIVNNARVIRSANGRILVPAAYVSGSISKEFNLQRVFCLYSDDDGRTWHESNELSLEGKALMEPDVAACADGSIYMTIRTALGHLYEARSRDNGATWADLRATALPAPAAPSTVFRDPNSADLWLFWCNRAGGGWKMRNPQVVAVSGDHGRTWGAPRPIETDPRQSYGYISCTVVKRHLLLTYYDWADAGQAPFQDTALRQRTIPLAWFGGHGVPPVFRTSAQPVLKNDPPDRGGIVSINGGLLAGADRWRLWYTRSVPDPTGRERLGVFYAESRDLGRTWTKDATPVLPRAGDGGSVYHPVVNREGERIVLHAWRHAPGGDHCLYRYVSNDDGRTFHVDPTHPLMAHPSASADRRAAAGEGRVSNDAFDVLRNADGSYEYFAATLVNATDSRTVIKHDNAPGRLRYIGRATSPDGVRWTPPQIVIHPDHEAGDPYDEQFYGLQVCRYRGFYLGLLQVYRVQSQTIEPEWAWSHNGVNWARTHTPCIPLGDEGNFDSRMIVFGRMVIDADEVVWLYAGYNVRHNATGNVSSAIGRATLPRRELDAWLDTLPQP